ncbi:xanthine dehydrogenase family protein molybdopterin-binding subunit [Reyranella aquatilis]|uniref:Xanthine dehydrogenase family protein molybdopterin-binding subunit n=1 Tax=Reyranella aquatilis TaxID=2035356 RepID=A0ABS8KRA1_9HYPH|nr:xanthine dehydrogenase family protein molybdopterin-binding subunit [Reyranella aquatilis]MCC8428600.1 xanthine dehydrogenase family protein molybdopterin-binding subunit [Reyranella aquatilis]
MADASRDARSMRRLEDARFLTGHGRYVEDIAEPAALHGHVLRSPHAHALIRSIDVSAAASMPGVHLVATAADLAADGLGHMPCLAAVTPMIVPPRPALATGRVRHVGDPVCFVVADSAELARESAERVEIDYQPLPSVVDGLGALAKDAPLLWDEAPGNLVYHVQRGDHVAVSEAMKKAAHVVEVDVTNNRVIVVPLEPRAGIARYDAATDTMDLELTGQGLHGIRRQLAEFVFKVAPERIQLHAPDVGGGFGMKNFLYPEWILLLWAARRLKRPVRWLADRAEDFVMGAQGRDIEATARLALDETGRILALDVAMVANLGAYLSGNGPGASVVAASTAQGGLYDIPAIAVDVRGALTNTTPVDAYRGAGKPEANYIVERAIEAAARALGRAPADLRRQNLIASFPHRTAMGMAIDSGDFVANLDVAVGRGHVRDFESRRAEARTRGRLRGQGVACFLETSRGAPNEGAEVRFDPDGRVTIAVGTESNGQGHETSFAQIASQHLGLPLEAFRYVQADTRAVRTGAGHGGARSMHMGGAALVKAMDAALAKARRLAAHLLQAGEAEIDYARGRFTVRGSDRGIDLATLATSASDPANLPDGMSPGLGEHVLNVTDVFTFPNGCHVAEVEIDPETGAVDLLSYIAVDDYGRLINPMLTEGQVQGGLAQGIGQALLEHTVYDPASGQLLTGSLMDYALPRATDLPFFDIELVERPTGANPLGVKGSGQAGCIGAPQTVMAAVLDALRPAGVERLEMPATPSRVWQALQRARVGD